MCTKIINIRTKESGFGQTWLQSGEVTKPTKDHKLQLYKSTLKYESWSGG